MVEVCGGVGPCKFTANYVESYSRQRNCHLIMNLPFGKKWIHCSDNYHLEHDGSKWENIIEDCRERLLGSDGNALQHPSNKCGVAGAAKPRPDQQQIMDQYTKILISNLDDQLLKPDLIAFAERLFEVKLIEKSVLARIIDNNSGSSQCEANLNVCQASTSDECIELAKLMQDMASFGETTFAEAVTPTLAPITKEPLLTAPDIEL